MHESATDLKPEEPMNLPGIFLSLLFIALAARLLVRGYHPQAVLLVCGLAMMASSLLIGGTLPAPQTSTGCAGFDLIRRIEESMSGRAAGVGLMIMSIGGFVAYMKRIGASQTLVYISAKPLSVFRNHSYLAAVLVIPIGQLLFICTPSATGLGLLLVASVFPILINIGVSRVTAASVISACTAFDMGPASANTARAAELIGKDNVAYFIEDQLPVVVPMTLLLMIVYYFTSRRYDRRTAAEPAAANREFRKDGTPLIYALLPVLPLILLIFFSRFVSLFPAHPVILNTTTAILVSLGTALLFELIRTRRPQEVAASLKTFWEGMGRVFANVITLIVAAEIFSTGLIGLGFIDSLVTLSRHLDFGPTGIGILMALLIFLASMLMGSGNASFFSFGPLVPGIAAQLGAPTTSIILPMQLASSMGRACSPIAGIIVAISEIAGVSPLDLARRDLIPMATVLIVLFVYHFAF